MDSAHGDLFKNDQHKFSGSSIDNPIPDLTSPRRGGKEVVFAELFMGECQLRDRENWHVKYTF